MTYIVLQKIENGPRHRQNWNSAYWWRTLTLLINSLSRWYDKWSIVLLCTKVGTILANSAISFHAFADPRPMPCSSRWIKWINELKIWLNTIIVSQLNIPYGIWCVIIIQLVVKIMITLMKTCIFGVVFAPNWKLNSNIFWPSVRLPHLSDYVPIIVSSCNFQELLPMTQIRSVQKVGS